MSIKLREKQLKNGQISFYLDIYHNKKRWYEFLEIHIQKNKPSPEDKDKKRLAQEIKSKREHELIVEDNGLINKTKKHGCFIEFYEQFVREKNKSLSSSVLSNLKKFAGNQPVPFSKLNDLWIKNFKVHLFKRCCNNTVASYLNVLSEGLDFAVRKKIIALNFLKDLPASEKLKKQDVFRTAFTIEELQHLSNTPCDIDIQIKQGYMFSAFTGLRWSDVNPLRWDEISVRLIQGEERYFMHFEQEKTTGIAYLPISDNAATILKTRQKEAPAEEKSIYVFPRLKETSEYDTIYQRMRAGLKKWAKAAGITPGKLHFHSSRHSFATNVLESSADGDLYTVSKLLGHKSITATQIYAHVRDNRKLAAVRALPKVNFDNLNDGVSKEFS